MSSVFLKLAQTLNILDYSLIAPVAPQKLVLNKSSNKKGMIRRRKEEGQRCGCSSTDKVSVTLFVRAIVPHKAEMYFS